MSNAKYTGHVSDGGLQGHSVGDTYPWAVVGYEAAIGTMWRAENLVTGERLPLHLDSRLAIDDAENAAQRMRALQAIERLSGHHLPLRRAA